MPPAVRRLSPWLRLLPGPFIIALASARQNLPLPIALDRETAAVLGLLPNWRPAGTVKCCRPDVPRKELGAGGEKRRQHKKAGAVSTAELWRRVVLWGVSPLTLAIMAGGLALGSFGAALEVTPTTVRVPVARGHAAEAAAIPGWFGF